MSVKPIPDGYHTITPYMVTDNAPRLIAFLKEAFTAEETEMLTDDQGAIRHAEFRIGSSMLMLSSSLPTWPAQTSSFYLYLPDVDAAYTRALQAGASTISPPADQFYGDRNAGVKDPCGNTWYLASRIENLSHDELKKRAAGAAQAGC